MITEKNKKKLHNIINKLTKSFGQFPKFVYNNKKFENKVFYSGPYFDKKEILAIMESLIFGKWFSGGEYVHKFEITFSKMFNITNSVMVNSGSSANLLMIAALKKYLKWSDGDEIIVSVVGFPTTLSAIILNNLKPVFVDIEFSTLNFDVAEIKNKITERTRAIFISPVLGNPTDMDCLVNLSNEHKIELVLDSCDSLGTKWNGEYLHNFAIASSFSFYPAHHIATGEGGMICSNNSEIIKIARSMAWWGRDCYCVGAANLLPGGTCKHRFDKWIPEHDGILDHKYIFTNVGYNLKPLDLQGAIGLVQLQKFGEIHKKRIKYKNEIEEIFLSNIIGLRGVDVLSLSDVCWFGVPLICDNEEMKYSLVEHLEKNGIQTRNYFAGNILIHPAYKHLGDWKEYENANKVLKRVFFVGCSPQYNKKTISYIKKIVKGFSQ